MTNSAAMTVFKGDPASRPLLSSEPDSATYNLTSLILEQNLFDIWTCDAAKMGTRGLWAGFFSSVVILNCYQRFFENKNALKHLMLKIKLTPIWEADKNTTFIKPSYKNFRSVNFNRVTKNPVPSKTKSIQLAHCSKHVITEQARKSKNLLKTSFWHGIAVKVCWFWRGTAWDIWINRENNNTKECGTVFAHNLVKIGH